MYNYMPSPIERYDRLLLKTNPGYSFTTQQRTLKFPSQDNYLQDDNMSYHFASNTEKIYSPFQTDYYLPPHLKSSQVYGVIHKGQCKGWKHRKTENYITDHMYGYGKNKQKHKQIRGRHVANETTNYDTQYRIYEQKIQGLSRKNYHCIKPRIKYLIEQDKPSKPNKLKYQSQPQAENQVRKKS